MKKIMLLTLLAATFIVAGCTSIINTPQGKIVSITERGLGLEVAQSPSTQSPEVKFGFFSSAVVFIPTATNSETGTVTSPNFANTFDFAQSGALAMGIGENIAAGNYQTSVPNGTNTVATQPIVPK